MIDTFSLVIREGEAPAEPLKCVELKCIYLCRSDGASPSDLAEFHFTDQSVRQVAFAS